MRKKTADAKLISRRAARNVNDLAAVFLRDLISSFSHWRSDWVRGKQPVSGS
jgi:hypothetical protein